MNLIEHTKKQKLIHTLLNLRNFNGYDFIPTFSIYYYSIILIRIFFSSNLENWPLYVYGSDVHTHTLTHVRFMVYGNSFFCYRHLMI